MKIVATGCAIGFLKEIVNHDFTSIAVKDNQTMEIGEKSPLPCSSQSSLAGYHVYLY